MKKDAFTTDDYLKAIRREQGKRATTYPKILQKMKRHGQELEEIVFRQREMNKQEGDLTTAEFIIDGVGDSNDVAKYSALAELMRELKMRKSYYPRLIYFKRLDQETAQYEIAVWESLTRWFAKEFLGLDELPTKRRKRLIRYCEEAKDDREQMENILKDLITEKMPKSKRRKK